MQPAHEPDGADLREFMRPIWSRRWLVLIVVVIATTIAYAYEERKPDAFTASTKIFIESSASDLAGATVLLQDDRNTRNQATLAQSRSVANEVARQLKFKGDPASLLASIQVAPEVGQDFVTITATRDTPQGAALVANGFAQAFIDLRAQAVRDKIAQSRRLAERELSSVPVTENTKSARDALKSQIKRFDVLEALPTASASQPDKALAPGVRSSPRPRRAALFALALSLAFATLAAYGLERFDRRLRRLAEISTAYRLPVLAALPRASRGELGSGLKLSDSFREIVRGLRTNLQLATVDVPIQTLLVTSGVASEGKSTVVRNLALAYQEAGLRVAVIECDLRRPTLAAQFNVAPTPGLTHVLLGECSLVEAVQVARVETSDREAYSAALAGGGHEPVEPQSLGTLSVLTSGGQIANPPTVLGDRRMKSVVKSARENNDIVIIDSPPLLAVADTLPLLAMVDGTLIVARLGVSTRSTARRVSEIIERVPGVEVLGVVANDVTESDMGELGYGYGYGYGYGSPSA